MSNLSKVVLVTGVAGFLGRYISRYFSTNGWAVIGLDTVSQENAPMANLIAYHQVQLPNSALSIILKSCSIDICIHCAGRASVNLSVDDPGADFQSSTLVTFELLNNIRLYSPACRVIFLSSAAVYGNPKLLPIKEDVEVHPLSPYGFHKLQCELICEEFSSVYGLRTASARIFSAYGPGLRRQVIWDIFYKALSESKIMLQGTGAESRDFIHAKDIANAMACIAQNAPMEGEVYNVANAIEVTISDLANIILSEISYKGILEFSGKLPECVPLNWCSDIAKLERLGYESSVSLEDGVKQYKNWVLGEISKI